MLTGGLLSVLVRWGRGKRRGRRESGNREGEERDRRREIEREDRYHISLCLTLCTISYFSMLSWHYFDGWVQPWWGVLGYGWQGWTCGHLSEGRHKNAGKGHCWTRYSVPMCTDRVVLGASLICVCMQCSPQTKFKAWWEGVVWVEPVATSKHIDYPYSHTKGNSVLSRHALGRTLCMYVQMCAWLV